MELVINETDIQKYMGTQGWEWFKKLNERFILIAAAIFSKLHKTNELSIPYSEASI